MGSSRLRRGTDEGARLLSRAARLPPADRVLDFARAVEAEILPTLRELGISRPAIGGLAATP
jgi:hypothetical protein